MTDRRHPSHYTAQEAARALGVAHITILRWVAAGKLPCWRTAGQTAALAKRRAQQRKAAKQPPLPLG